MSITVLNPGLLTTVQDLGRVGYQQFGVSVSGVMDPRATTIANILVNNPDGEAVLECTMMGPHLQFNKANCIAITGGDLGVEHSNEQQYDGIQRYDHGAVMDEIEISKYRIIVETDHPDGDGGFVKMLLAGEGCNQRIQQACHNRQNDLAPQVGSFPTDVQDAGHCRTCHAKHHQPGQYIFRTDIKMRFSFHNTFIIHFITRFCNKKHQRSFALMFGIAASLRS